jgi:hypothetical protein
MKDLIIPVNNEALSRAMVSIVGDQATAMILNAYKVIDAAMVFGYERGAVSAERFEQGKIQGDLLGYARGYDEGHRQRQEDEWEAGYAKGLDDGNGRTEEDDQSAYDDGYVDGVSDCRMWPSFADQNVDRLCAQDEIDMSEYDEHGHFMELSEA